jgi:outer membrane protein assembly factor BamB
MNIMHRANPSHLPRPRAGAFAMLVACLVALAAAAGCGSGAGTASSTALSPPGGSSSTGSTSRPTSTSGPTSASGATSTSAATSTSGPTSIQPGGGQQAGADWPTYHHDAARSGMSSDQEPLGDVRQAWTSPGFDAPVYAQPLVVGGRVLVASEGNTVYALEAASGAVVWQRNLGEPVPGGDLPCGNIDPSGITGTPVIDTTSGTLYVVANLRSGPHHELYALDVGDGAVRWHRTVDPPGLAPAVEQQRGALALSGGRLYVPFGGLYGDCGRYKGAVASVAADGSGGLASYIVPTSRMAGIWNPGGPAIDSSGNVWVTTGNSAGQSTFDFGNALIRLSAGLEVQDYFAPADWARLNAGDVDLGSLGSALLPNQRVLVMGKDGIAYLTNAADLGHVGNPLTSLDLGSSAFGAAAISGSTVFLPCSGALIALGTGGDKLSVTWSAAGGSGPPIVAAGAVWALGYDGRLKAMDPSNGTVRFSAQLGSPVSRFISLAAAGGRVFVADGDKLVAFALR